MEHIFSLLPDFLSAVRRTGNFIRQENGKVTLGQIEQKSLNNLVSYVDKTAEKMLVQDLGPLLPEAVFLTEEQTVRQLDGDLRWIIDPLDGTTNFLHGIPLFSISVALARKGKIVIGIVYDIMQDAMYHACLGKGAFCNGQPIHVSKQKDMGQALLVTGFPYGKNESILKKYIDVFSHLTIHTRGVRRLGSAAIDLAYVAQGRFDGFYEYGLNAWDVAAGTLIVREAGGRVTDFRLGGDFVFGAELIASNHHLHFELQTTIKDVFLK